MEPNFGFRLPFALPVLPTSFSVRLAAEAALCLALAGSLSWGFALRGDVKSLEAQAAARQAVVGAAVAAWNREVGKAEKVESAQVQAVEEESRSNEQAIRRFYADRRVGVRPAAPAGHAAAVPEAAGAARDPEAVPANAGLAAAAAPRDLEADCAVTTERLMQWGVWYDGLRTRYNDVGAPAEE